MDLNNNNFAHNNGSFIPAIVYNNAEADKLQILTENFGKAGIYLWTHIQSRKMYVGSAIDLSKRLENYYRLSYISNKSKGNSYIYNAIISYGYSAFSLTILEYIDILNKSKDEAKALILEREQHYLDTLQPEYNILKTAGSPLGYIHTEESLTKRSGDNHFMYGKTHSVESLVKMSAAKKGENNPMFGKIHSEETLVKMGLAKAGENNPMYGRTGENNPIFGRTHTAGTKALISLANSKKVFVYSLNPETKEIILYKSFDSCIETAKFFNCSTRTLYNYLDKKKFYKKEWILSSSLINKD